MTVKQRLPKHLFASMALLLVSLFTCNVSWTQTGIDWETYWPGDDDKIIDAINEGELNFLDTPPEEAVHHHSNTIIVRQSSLETGWVRLEQCHENLDIFPRVQIVYNEGKVRQLRITRHRNIGEARVEGHTVQLTDVKSNALLCVEAESRALIAQKDGTYIMQNGPFMRRFLDGYFPMRVSIDIKLPANLSFVAIEPVEQKGFKVSSEKQSLHLDTWFEGRLVTQIRFKLIPETKRVVEITGIKAQY